MIALSSIAGVVGPREMSPYNASKHAVNELATAGIAMNRYGTNEEVANLALFLASDESSYCTGGIHMIDGGLTAA
jgi:NAD(P)-dependent dehydrogenase (short-subunit alcohol dehydrogenase family)